MRKLAFVFVAAGALAFAACGSDKKTTTDGGTDAKPPVVKKDKGVTPEDDTGVPSGEGIVLPDQGVPGEGVIVGDGPTTTFNCDRTKIGVPCKADPSTGAAPECGENASCLITSQDGSGVCSCDCEPDDPQTPFTNEDKCGEGGINAECGELEMSNGSTAGFCLLLCQPTLGTNTCTAPLSCQPISPYYTRTSMPVCLFSGCADDKECPATTGESTDGTGFCTVGDAASCPAGQECSAVVSGNTKGVCSEPSTCDKTSGLCGKHATNNPTAAIGAACKSDKDCGEYQNCSMEIDRKGVFGQKDHGEACTKDDDCCGYCDTQGGNKCAGSCLVHARNGYCMLYGCGWATASAYKEFACPSGGTCDTLFGSWGSCWKACDPKDAATCRGNANDKWGDYECRSWNMLGGGAYTATPICEFGDRLPCDALVAYQLDCASVALTCYDPKTAQPSTNVTDPAGYCMDDTASGPVPTPTP